MNASKTTDEEITPTSIFDPFPEPQTIPRGWDVSNFISKRKPSVVSKAASEVEKKYRYPGIMYD
jgi:hypothetical protein